MIYKKYKNKLTMTLRNAEKIYYKDLLDEQTNVKGTRKILNTVINIRKNLSTYPDCYENDGVRDTGTNDIANGFNTFFATIGQQLATKIDTPVICVAIVHDYLKHRTKKVCSYTRSMKLR
jgi:hypothetical protein